VNNYNPYQLFYILN